MSKSHKILIIEDEVVLVKVIQTRFELEGFDVVSARSVEEALTVLEKSSDIDAIWLDHYLLGKETGLDFVAKLKEMDNAKNIPIYVVSNTASNEKFNSYMRLGVNKYYVKSDFKLETIVKDIKDFLEK